MKIIKLAMPMSKTEEEPIDVSVFDGTNVDKGSPYYHYSMEDAIKTGDLEAVKSVVSRLGEDNINQKIGRYVFSQAVSTGNLEIVKYLVSLGVDPKQSDTIAIETGNLELIKYLGSLGLFRSLNNAVESAIRTKNLEIVKYIETLSPIKPYNFSQAIRFGTLEIVKYIYSQLPMSIPGNSSYLNDAVKKNDIEMTKFIISIGSRCDWETFDWAIQKRNLEIMYLLESIGCTPTDNSVGRAFATGDIEIAKYVVSLGPRIDEYSLQYAINASNLEMIKYAVSLGVKPSQTSLTHAVSKTRDLEIIKYVRSIGGTPNINTLPKALKCDQEIINFIEEVIVDEIKEDVSMVNVLLHYVQTKNIADALLDSQYDLSRSNDIFEAKSICDEMSSYTGKSHYDKKQFAEFFSKELDFFKEGHDLKTELQNNVLDRILINQSKFMKSKSSFYAVLNSFIDSSDLLDEALQTRERKEVQNWLMEMSTKGLLANENENLFTYASLIPDLINIKKKKLEEEGMKEINKLFPEKNRNRFDAIKKLRNKINNQTRIGFTKYELKEIDTERNNMDYKNMLEEIEIIPQARKDVYRDMMTNLINHDDGSFFDKDNFVKNLLFNEKFGVGIIPDQKIEVEANGRKYLFEILDKEDPLGVVVGDPAFSGCCFTIGGESEKSLIESYINPSTGILVVYDDKGKFLAQSWIWLTKDGKSLVLDNVEVATWIKQGEENAPEDTIMYKIFNVGEGEDGKEDIRTMIQEAYRQFSKQYKGQTGLNIYIGSGYDSLGIKKMGLEELKNWNVYSNYPTEELHDVYTDAEVAYRLANWYGKYVTATKVKHLDNLDKKDFRRIHEIEEEHFDPEYAQPADDIADDADQRGFVGVGVEDDEKLQGYLYGYEFITEDNLGEMDFANMKCYSEECKSPHFVEEITRKSDEGKILYVANLAVSNYYRRSLNKLLFDFLEKVRNTHYEYLAFEALSDSYKLLFKGDQVNQERLSRFGVELISVVTCDDQKCVLMRIR